MPKEYKAFHNSGGLAEIAKALKSQGGGADAMGDGGKAAGKKKRGKEEEAGGTAQAQGRAGKKAKKGEKEAAPSPPAAKTPASSKPAARKKREETPPESESESESEAEEESEESEEESEDEEEVLKKMKMNKKSAEAAEEDSDEEEEDSDDEEDSDEEEDNDESSDAIEGGKNKARKEDSEEGESDEESDGSEEESDGSEEGSEEEESDGEGDDEKPVVKAAVRLREAAWGAKNKKGVPEETDLWAAHKEAAGAGAGAEEAFFDECGEVGSRAARLLHELLARASEFAGSGDACGGGGGGAGRGGAARRDAAPLISQVKVAGGDGELVKQYVGMPLWSAIRRHYATLATAVHGAVKGAGAGGLAAADAAAAAAAAAAAPKSTFRDFYMTTLTDGCGAELDAMRAGEGGVALNMSMLMDSIEAGMDVFSPLEQELVVQGLSQQRRRQQFVNPAPARAPKP